MVALAYHFVREHVANDVVEVKKINSKDDYADPFTKSLGSNEFHGFFYVSLCVTDTSDLALSICISTTSASYLHTTTQSQKYGENNTQTTYLWNPT